MKKQINYKISIIILVVTLIAVSLTGCTTKEIMSEDIEETDANTETSEPERESHEVKTKEEKTVSIMNNEETGSTSGEDIMGEMDTIREDDKCADIIEKLRKQAPVLPAEAEILSEMVALVTFSRVIDEQGEIFAQMDNTTKSRLRRQILNSVILEESDFYKAIPIESADGRYDADMVVSVDDASALFKDIYGEENFTPAEYEVVEDGYILFSFGDGEPWESIEHMQFFEDDGHYLLSGPSFYEDNGGCISFKGYADILFRKNPESRYGVTLLYGRYRADEIKVSKIETSSALPPAGGKTYDGENLLDGDPSTVWSEGVPGTGVGETITLHLDKKQLVYGVVIVNGYTSDYSLYSSNGKLTEAEADFGNGKVVKNSLEGYGYEDYSPENFADSNRNRIELDEPVITDTITITITGAQKGEKYDDTCASEIMVY